jgi:hypothetical protein
MATFSVSKMNKARHKQGRFSQQDSEARKKRLEDEKNKEQISEEEHEKRLKMLKEIGLLKE